MACIKKEPIVEFITKGLNNPDQTKAYGYDAIEILAEIEYAPTADVVEVVRCKDCEHFCPYEGEEHKGDCAELVGLESCVYEDDFCSYGEKALKERNKE